jgi:MerR family transcriptional regulator, redox-sensitive transcriptional activator SoxR
MTINAVAQQAAVRPSAIRYYESLGLIPAPARQSGRRRFTPDVLPRLALIAAAKQMGFTIAEIGTLVNGFDATTPASARWQTLAAQKLPEVDALIARALGMKRLLEDALQCPCLSLDECALAFHALAETGCT